MCRIEGEPRAAALHREAEAAATWPLPKSSKMLLMNETALPPRRPRPRRRCRRASGGPWAIGGASGGVSGIRRGRAGRDRNVHKARVGDVPSVSVIASFIASISRCQHSGDCRDPAASRRSARAERDERRQPLAVRWALQDPAAAKQDPRSASATAPGSRAGRRRPAGRRGAAPSRRYGPRSRRRRWGSRPPAARRVSVAASSGCTSTSPGAGTAPSMSRQRAATGSARSTSSLSFQLAASHGASAKPSLGVLDRRFQQPRPWQPTVALSTSATNRRRSPGTVQARGERGRDFREAPGTESTSIRRRRAAPGRWRSARPPGRSLGAIDQREGVLLDRVDLALAAGEVLAVVGASGSGKTTLGLALQGERRGKGPARRERAAVRRGTAGLPGGPSSGGSRGADRIPAAAPGGGAQPGAARWPGAGRTGRAGGIRARSGRRRCGVRCTGRGWTWTRRC